jgi:hypothetical protein
MENEGTAPNDFEVPSSITRLPEAGNDPELYYLVVDHYHLGARGPDDPWMD